MPSQRRWNVLAGALLAAAALGIFWDADRPFQKIDESWQAGDVAGMLEQGDYLVPYFNGQPHFDKPPLSYWLSAPLMALVGNPQVAMRIIPGFCGIALLWLLYVFGRTHFSPGAGIAAMLVFFLNYDAWYNHGYKTATMEGLLDLEFALIFWLNTRLRERPQWLRWIGLLLGLVALTKTAFPVIPAVVTGVNLWWLRKDRPVPGRLIGQSLLIAAAVALPWFIAVIAIYGQPAIEGLFTFNIWHRMLGHHEAATAVGQTLGRREPWYVLQHYLVYGQPWSLLVWPALLAAWRNRAGLDPDARRLLGLAAVWFGAVLTLFLISRGRWAWYVFSIHFPAALLIAALFTLLYEGRLSEDYRPIILAMTAAACTASPLLYAYNPYIWLLVPLDPTLPLQLIAAAALVAAFAVRWRPSPPPPRWLAAACWAAAALGIGLSVFLSRRSELLQPLRVLSLAITAPFLLDYGRRCAPAACARTAFGILAFVAVTYLAAPLQFGGRTLAHPSIVWMEDLIRRGSFEDGRLVEYSHMSYYYYVTLAQEYGDRFDVAYDERTHRLTIKPRPQAPTHDG